MTIKYPFRLLLVSIIFLSISFLIVFEIINIQRTFDASPIDQLDFSTKRADRGNIYSHDYKLLAVNTTQYDLRIDAVFAKKMGTNVEAFASDLSNIFYGKTNYLTKINRAKKNKNKYCLLENNISFYEVEKIKNTSYFKNNKLNGGIIINQYTVRKYPDYAQRTVGHLYKNNTPKYGLEYHYNHKLMGRDGRVLELYDPGAEPRAINSPDNIEPLDGSDLITTLDLDLQDIVHEALLRQLERFGAEFGTSILMEVSSGEIKAVSNLKKVQNKKYAEVLNFAATYQFEPGSTFKLASLMAYLEDSYASIDDTIDCKNGSFKFKGAPIATKDTKPLSRVTIKEAFAKSSNIGVGRLIQNYYKDAQKFIDRLYTFGLGSKSKIDLYGVPAPYIPSPKDPSWSGISLPWMSYGYGLKLTALDLLTFYNAVANNGVYVHPYLGKYFMNGSKKESIHNNNINHIICSEKTINQLKLLLREVIQNGTGSNMLSLPFFVSGKTGTAVTNPNDSIKKYHASFVGYFPSNKPKYSCIVLIDNPNVTIGFHGSQVASPVFKEIAEEIYAFEGATWPQSILDNRVENEVIYYKLNSNTGSSVDSIIDSYYTSNQYPDLIGLHLSDALYVLESIGIEYKINGDFGHIVKQYPKPKTLFKAGLAMTLFI